MNALDILDRTYPSVNVLGYQRSDVIIGALYLITRDYTDARVVIARQRASGNKHYIYLNGYNWRATLVNPVVQVGDEVYALERGDGSGSTLRHDRKRVVTEVRDDGIMAKYSTYEPFLITHWVLAGGDPPDPARDRHNPDRRKLVLDKLSTEGMSRIGDVGYATSASEFFKTFDLPRPEVQPTAILDLEKKFDLNSIPSGLRYSMDDVGITSLRAAVATGRARVKLPKSQCRCKEITDEQATAAWKQQFTGWTVVKVHKVECLWCTEIARVNEVI